MPYEPDPPDLGNVFDDTYNHWMQNRIEIQTRLQHQTHLKLRMQIPPARPLVEPNTFPLADSVFLEKLAPHKNGGMWLSWIYAYWDDQKMMIPFWVFVDQVKSNYNLFATVANAGALAKGQHALSSPVMFELFKRGVKYIEDSEKRQKYLVSLGTQLCRHSPLGQLVPLDTQEIYAHYKERYAARIKAFTTPQVNVAQPSDKMPKLLSKAGPFDGRGWLLWVWGKDDNFYSHIGKLGSFHHSSFFAGAAVKGAGEWKVEHGKLTGIVGLSGHYKPSFKALVDSVSFLQEKKAVVPNETIVYLWEKARGNPVPILATDFLKHPQLFERTYDFHEK